MHDALLDWRADLHSCGRPLSESLQLAGRPDPDYVIGEMVCLACRKLDEHRAIRAKGDEQARKDGRQPDTYRLDRVDTRAEALARIQAQRDREAASRA